MGILVLLFQVWLVVMVIGMAILLPIKLLMALAEELTPRARQYDNVAAARAAAKPQRIVFWWFPHDQGP